MPEKTYSPVQLPDGRTVKGEDLQFTVIKEDWIIYQLEDGARIRAKLTAQKISRAIDPATGSILLVEGEPHYGIRYNVQFVADVPETLKKKEA